MPRVMEGARAEAVATAAVATAAGATAAGATVATAAVATVVLPVTAEGKVLRRGAKASPPARSMQQTRAIPLPHMQPRQIRCTPSALGALNGFFNASEAARLNANAKSAVGRISKTYAERLTAYLGLDPAATEAARTTALAELAAALADASNKPVSAEVVSAINTRLAEQDPALATALASADPTLNQSIADTASALSRTGGEQEATGGQEAEGEQAATGGEQEPVVEPTAPN
jgi:hypothetical protein